MRACYFFQLIEKFSASGRARQPHRRNRREKRDDVGLAVAASFFQDAADVRADCVRRSAAVNGDVFHGFAGGKKAGDARLGRGQIEQGLNEFDGRRLRHCDGRQDKRGGAAEKKSREQTDGWE